MLRQGILLGPLAPDLDNTSVGKWQKSVTAFLWIRSFLSPRGLYDKEAFCMSFLNEPRTQYNSFLDSSERVLMAS